VNTSKKEPDYRNEPINRIRDMLFDRNIIDESLVIELERLISQQTNKAVETELTTLINKVKLAGNKGSGLTAYKGVDDDDEDNSYSRLSRLSRQQIHDYLEERVEALNGGRDDTK